MVPSGSTGRLTRQQRGPRPPEAKAASMDLSQAIEQANAFVFPGFLTDDDSLTQERTKNE